MRRPLKSRTFDASAGLGRLTLAALLGLGCSFDPSGGESDGVDGDSSLGSGGSTGEEADPAVDEDEDDDDAYPTGTTGDPSTSGGVVSTSTTEPPDTVGGSSGDEPDPTTRGPIEGCGDRAVVGPEVCDDGNTDELDGCTSTCELGPTGIDALPRIQTMNRFGGWRWEGLDVDVSCDSGEVLVGLSGVFSYYVGYFVLARVNPVCASMELVNAVPSDVTFGDESVGQEIGTFGSPDEESFNLRCPAGEVLSGIHGRGGEYLDQLGLVCRAVSLTSEQDDITLGEAGYFQGFGSNAGSGQQLLCPGEMLANGIRVVGNDYAIGIFLNCADFLVGFGREGT